MNWYYAALFHAISAAMRQAIQSRLLQNSNPIFLSGIIFFIASVLIATFHFFANGTLWFNGSIPPGFYWAMTIFVIANSVASVLAFNVIKQVALSEVVILMGISAGLMVLAEWILFGNVPTGMVLLGISILIGAAALFFMEQKKRGERANVSWNTIWQTVASVTLYNFVTPSTNKYCVMVTSASFASWIAHAFIGGILLVIFFTLFFAGKVGFQKQTRKEVRLSNLSGYRMVFWVFVVAAISGASNFLLSLSFQMGGSIPGALMLKRTLTPLLIFLFAYFMDRKGQITWRIIFSLILSIIGSLMTGGVNK